MREIKFRFRIQLPAGFNKVGNPEIVETHIYTLDELTNGYTLLTHSLVKVLSRDEYTGLKDKNGTEIYEGDIVDFCGLDLPRPHRQGSFQNRGNPTCMTNEDKFVLASDDDVTIRVIEWDKAGFAPFVWTENAREDLEPPKAEHCEIIGNILEHPELMGVAK